MKDKQKSADVQPSPRRRYCRPCLPVSLTPEQRRQVVAFALELAGPVPGVEGNEVQL